MQLRRLGAIALLAVTAACRDDGATAPALDLTRLVPTGGTQLVLQEEPGPTPGTTTYVVRVITTRGDLASYQGTVTFTPGSAELVGALAARGGDGEMFLVNPQAEAGTIRFAAFATERFSTDEAFRFTVRPAATRSAMQLRGTLDVAGVVGGSAIEAAQLKAAKGVYDARGRLIER
jgi:hypothetical protein